MNFVVVTALVLLAVTVSSESDIGGGATAGWIWRDDGRCGPEFLVDFDGSITICNSFDIEGKVCCSAKGYCSNEPKDCVCDGCVDYGVESPPPF